MPTRARNGKLVSDKMFFSGTCLSSCCPFQVPSNNFVEILVSLNHLDETITESSISSKIFDDLWNWDLGLENFEQVHGVSRLALLLPDKLATSMEITKENLPDPKDDGCFLIDLVQDLLKVYQDQLRELARVRDFELILTCIYNFTGTELKSKSNILAFS